MASVSFHVPVAIILLGAGLVACFFGLRLLHTLLAVYGFIAGAALGIQFLQDAEAWLGIILTVACGLLGALAALAAYLAGVALIGAGLGAIGLNLVYRGVEPEAWIVLATCLFGALLAVVIRRYVLIAATSIGGAWTALVGGLALAGDRAAVAAASGNIELLPPVADARDEMGFVIGLGSARAPRRHLSATIDVPGSGADRPRDAAAARRSPPTPCRPRRSDTIQS